MMAMPIVVKRTGAIAAGPLNHHKGILYADIEEETARRARRSLDVCGQYSRPDVFAFSVI
jgi:nitrilase